jgi:hypothetical protein
MALHPFFTFNKTNRRLIFLLIASHLLWSAAIFALDWSGRLLETATPWWSGIFIALQLFAAAQLLLPALLLDSEARSRGFYLFWGMSLALAIWLSNQLPTAGLGQQLLTALKSGLLLLVATLTGAALARYIQRLWEIVPICVVMTLADFASWRYGPTAAFTEQIQRYRLTPTGPPPLVDMILIKLAFPGAPGLAPLFGISDWIMVVFFAIVARRHGVNDNLLGSSGEALARQGKYGRYLPVSLVALFVAIILAQATGLFIPALPLIALIMLLWYASRYLLLRRRI